MPEENWQKGHWNAYVAGGETKEERNARIKECPDFWQEDVKNHVRTVFKLRADAKKKRVRG